MSMRNSSKDGRVSVPGIDTPGSVTVGVVGLALGLKLPALLDGTKLDRLLFVPGLLFRFTEEFGENSARRPRVDGAGDTALDVRTDGAGETAVDLEPVAATLFGELFRVRSDCECAEACC